MGILGRIFNLSFSPEERRIIDAIKSSPRGAYKISGRGALSVDIKAVTNTPEFREYALKAKQIVEETK